MATVRLGRYELKQGLLPPVCLKCGAEATTERTKKFSWHPSWIIILLLFGLLPYAIVALVLTKRMTITVPFCEQHKNHWSWRTWFIVGGFVFFLIAGGAALFLLLSQADQRKGAGDQTAGIICAATGIAALIWLIAAAIIQSLGIRPTEITDNTITLTHVSRDFVDALKEARKSYPADEDE